MTIRWRIAFMALLVTVPQLIGLTWWDGRSRHAAAEVFLGSLLERVMAQPDADLLCLADPEGWADLKPNDGRGQRDDGRGQRDDGRGQRAGHGPHLRESNPSMRLVPPRIYSADVDGPTGVLVSLSPSAWSAVVRTGVRTGWPEPCAGLVVEGSTRPGVHGGMLPATPVWFIPLILVATLMWLAVAPVVRRIQRLTDAVRSGVHPVAMEGNDELAVLSRAFDAEVERRLARELALRDFVADTAHDVRIPLTVLRGHLVALESTPSDATLASAQAEAHFLGALVDNLAARARMNEPRKRGSVDLVGVVERVVARHRPIAERHGISITYGVAGQPVVVLGDITLVEQALSNLVYNAVHYNREGGHVAVTLDEDGGRFQIAVVDDGPGVSADDLVRLTERGFRGTDARNRDDRGSGLGLDIVGTMARQHAFEFTLGLAEAGGLRACLVGLVEAKMADSDA